jgi:hypothetical protein
VEVLAAADENLQIVRDAQGSLGGNRPLVLSALGARADEEPASAVRALDLVASILLRDAELDPLGIEEKPEPVAL